MAARDYKSRFIGKELSKKLKDKAMLSVELAEATKISNSSISAWRNDRLPASLDNIKKMEKVLGPFNGEEKTPEIKRTKYELFAESIKEFMIQFRIADMSATLKKDSGKLHLEMKPQDEPIKVEM